MLDINLVQVDPASFTKKRKPNISACVRCHERKVKCDAGLREGGRGPCKNCLVSGVICRTHLDGRYRGGAKTGSQHDDAEPSAASIDSEVDDAAVGALPVASQQSGLSINRAESPVFENSSPESLQGINVDTPHHACQNDQHDTGGSVYLPQLDLPGEDTIESWQLPDLADQAISAPSTVPLMRIDRFEAYVKDSLGSYAPSFLQQQHDQGNPHANTVSEPHNSGDPTTGPNWFQDGRATGPLKVNMSSRSTVHLEHQVVKLDSADMEYLKAKGAFDLPPRRLQEDLVEAYFADVHPTAPVINRHEFLSAFHRGGSPSRLLLFAIFTSGSRACRNPALLDSQGTNQSSAQRFYRATKALLDTGYEQSRLVRVQALLLLTWWWDKKDDGGRNMRSCAVDAINTAQSVGMHRWDHYPKDDIVLGRLWKRIWWTCLNRDVAVAVSHGLPCIISLSDFDVYPLIADDFIEEPDVAEHLRQYPYQPVEVAFSIEVIRVAEALHHIHQDHFVTQHLQKPITGSIAEREANLSSLRDLGQAPLPPGEKGVRIGFPDDYNDRGIRLCRDWLDRVPQALKYDVDDIQKHAFWPAFLHILYFTNIMLRFRGKAVARQAQGRAEAERLYCQARGIAAATMISKILRNVRAYNQVLRFTGQLTISLFNCLIFFLIEGQSPNNEVRQDAQAKYSMCLHVLYEFSQLWVSASLIHRLFEALQANMQLSRCASSSLFDADRWQVPLPGLRVSSDVTESYMRRLLAIDFHYEGSSVAGLSVGQSSSGLETDFLSRAGATQYFEDSSRPSPDLTLPLGASFPDSFNVEQWVNFFGLDGSPPADNMDMSVYQKESGGY